MSGQCRDLSIFETVMMGRCALLVALVGGRNCGARHNMSGQMGDLR